MSIQLEGTSAHQLPTTNEVQTPVTPTDLAIDELVDDLPISQSYGEARYPKW